MKNGTVPERRPYHDEEPVELDADAAALTFGIEQIPRRQKMSRADAALARRVTVVELPGGTY